MKKSILCILLIVILMAETSCRSVSPNAVSGGGVSGDAVSGEEISITFEDASGKKQELKAGEVDTKDMGVKMCDIEEGSAIDDHFYSVCNTRFEIMERKGH